MAEPLTPEEERYLRETHEWCVSDGMNHEAHRWIATLDAERALHPVSDATPDLAAAGRWRRDGWHDTACWQAWIADPERGCICA
jgi:hypothetical protein